MNVTIKFWRLQLGNSEYLGRNLPKKVFLVENLKSEHHHLILNIEISLESVTKIVRLTPPAPLFNVENKFTCLFMTSTAWHIIFKLGTKLSREKEGILGIFEYII